MDQDLHDALRLLKADLELSDEQAEELLCLLTQAVENPFESVLYEENADWWYPLGGGQRGQRCWAVAKKVYLHTFLAIVVETSAKHRTFLDIIPIANVK